ncbi:MAG: hypothetical protein CVT63_04835 [Candidatus Anoxymicrobium japonicum]|uniref:Uncharacterized protein n=1 Tax=Candidatus Anoxymicrobium japonicum TaxID=2013648 RepID=A0A2N3G621_9ACTN|nr:MAG: hypothetical protein CVT63_04835 [Candidatus Anoxymicrobium japonicum]
MRDRKAFAAPAGSRKMRVRWKSLLFIIAISALIGCYCGLQIPEERRNRINRLLFEGREMWFRIFV